MTGKIQSGLIWCQIYYGKVITGLDPSPPPPPPNIGTSPGMPQMWSKKVILFCSANIIMFHFMYSLHLTKDQTYEYEQNYVVFSITEALNMPSWAGVICFLDASCMMLFHRHVTSHCCVFHLFSNVIPVSHHSLLPALLVANLHPSS